MNIVDESNVVVARRQFLLNPKGARCLCLWSCDCYCFEAFLTAEPKNLCRSMSPQNEIRAGFYDDGSLEEMQDEIVQSMELKRHLLIVLPAVVLLFIVLLGEFESNVSTTVL